MNDTPAIGASSPATTNTQSTQGSEPDAAAFQAAVAEYAGMYGVIFMANQSMQMMNRMKADNDEQQQS